MNILQKAMPEKATLCPHCKQEVNAKATICPHCHGKITQWTVKKVIIAGIACFFAATVFATFVSSMDSTSASPTTASVPVSSTSVTPVSTSIEVGGTGYLRLPNGGTGKVFVTTTQDAFEQYTKAAVANDTYGMAQMALNGQGYFVVQGTKVLEIDHNSGAAQVRILEGDHIGEAVWVASEFVSSK